MFFEQVDKDIVIRVKAVPGASRDAIAGTLGDRLKIRVAAPPEGGKANKAICALLAGLLGVRKGDVTIESGHSGPEKRILIHGVTADQVRDRLLSRS